MVKGGTPTTGCKARQFGPFVYAASGMPATNIGVPFDSFQVASTLKWQGTGRDAVEQYTSVIEKRLNAFIAWSLENDKAGLDDLRRVTNGKIHTGVFIARETTNGVVSYERIFTLSAGYKLSIERDDFPSGPSVPGVWQSIHTPRELYNRILSYLANRPRFWFNVEIADRVRELLENTIRKDDPTVGLPVTVVRVLPEGITWMHEGECTPEARQKKQAAGHGKRSANRRMVRENRAHHLRM
jgi:hypothetical protein